MLYFITFLVGFLAGIIVLILVIIVQTYRDTSETEKIESSIFWPYNTELTKEQHDKIKQLRDEGYMYDIFGSTLSEAILLIKKDDVYVFNTKGEILHNPSK